MPRANKRKPQNRTDKKARPIKKRLVITKCPDGCKEFTVVKTEKGCKRTCKKCKVSITEIGKVFTPISDTTRNGFRVKMEAVKV